MGSLKPAGNMLWAILFFFAATFGFSGCGDVNNVSTPPPPEPAPEPTVLTITMGSPINGTINRPFTVTLAVAAGTPPYLWSIVGNQPPGPNLTLDSTSGVISGTPTGTPNTTIITTRTYLVVDSTKPTAQAAEKALTISINAISKASIAASASITSVPQAIPTITPFTLPNGTVNVSYPNIQGGFKFQVQRVNNDAVA